MKAMVIEEFGSPDVLRQQELQDPEPGPDRALVMVHGSSVNPLDTIIRQGLFQAYAPVKLPAVLGVDVAGEVVKVGPGVTTFTPGDRVYAYQGLGAGGGYGALAEAAVDHLAKVPKNLDLVTAGTVPGVGATAYEAFTAHAPLKPGMRVFVNGAAGGVGTFAVMVAKALGAEVTGTCSTEKAEMVSSLGAQVVDYKKTDPFARTRSFDVVLNTVRGADETAMLGLLDSGGTLVTIVADPSAPEPRLPGEATRRIAFVVKPDAACLAGLSALIERGHVKPIVEKVYPVTKVAEAHRRVETGRVAGKVAIDVTPFQ